MLVLNLTNGEIQQQFKIPQCSADVSCRKVIEYQQTIEIQKPATLIECEKLETEAERIDFSQNLSKENYNEWFNFRLNQVKFWGDIPEDYLKSVPMTETAPGRMGLTDLINYITESLNIFDENYIESFEFKGKTYHAPPNPVNMYNPELTDPMRGATLGEYATSQELYRALTMMNKGDCLGIVHMLAVCFRLEGEDFPIRPNEQTQFVKDRVEHFKDLNYDIAMRAGFFFVTHRLNWTKDFQSLNAILEVMTKGSGKSMDFIRSFQQLLSLVYLKMKV